MRTGEATDAAVAAGCGAAAAQVRRAVADARRIVVKVGSSSLTSVAGGRLDPETLAALVDILATRRLSGQQVVLVSSGAIAAGMGPLGLLQRPGDLATQQAAASVGQGALVAAYQQRSVARADRRPGALTADDVPGGGTTSMPAAPWNDCLSWHRPDHQRERHRGDPRDRSGHDRLLSPTRRGRRLVILTDVDALRRAAVQAGVSSVPFVGSPDELAAIDIGDRSTVGSGGMVTKVEAADRRSCWCRPC